MAGRKKKTTGQEFTDILEKLADKYVNELPGASSDEYLALQAQCIRDLAMAFILEQARRGVWKASGAAWHNVEKADNMLIQLGGNDASKSSFKMEIEGLDASAIANFIAKAKPKDE